MLGSCELRGAELQISCGSSRAVLSKWQVRFLVLQSALSHSITLVCPRVAKEGGGLSFLVFSGCEISDL